MLMQTVRACQTSSLVAAHAGTIREQQLEVGEAARKYYYIHLFKAAERAVHSKTWERV